MKFRCFRHKTESPETTLQKRNFCIAHINSLTTLLKGCADGRYPLDYERIYSSIVRNGLQEHGYLSCLLIRMLSACGCSHRACRVFLDLADPNHFTWAVIIEAHVQHFRYADALTHYEHMLVSCFRGLPQTFVAVLKACDHLQELGKGMFLHVQIMDEGLDKNLHVQCALLSMYANCGCLDDTQNLFDALPNRDHALWSVMLKGFLQHKQLHKAFQLVEEMQKQGFQLNRVMILVLLKALGNMGSIIEKEGLHSNVVVLGLESDVHIQSSILSMYIKCQRFAEAVHVFKHHSLDRDTVLWNVMVAGIADYGQQIDSIQFFEEFKLQKVSPNEATYASLLKCVVSADEGRYVHIDATKLGLETCLKVQISLIDMYTKHCCLIDGHNVLDHIYMKDVVSFSSLMSGYKDQGQNMQVFELYLSMLQMGISPDKYTFSCLLQATDKLEFGHLIYAGITEEALDSSSFVGNDIVNMYCRCGHLDCAEAAFNLLVTQSAVSYSMLISGYVDDCNGIRALELFCQSWLVLGKFDSVLAICSLKACAITYSVIDASLISGAIIEQGLHQEVSVSSALVDCFTKMRSLENARKFSEMLLKFDVISYCSLITCYIDHGHYETAFHLFERMKGEGLKPDAISWVSMLKACSGAGAIAHGRKVHADIVKHGLEWNSILGSALINMHATSGDLVDARKVFDSLCSKDSASWCAMITAYVHYECNEQAIELYREGQQIWKPTHTIFLCALKACSKLTSLYFGMLIHSEITMEGSLQDVSIGNALIDMYFKCGCLNSAINIHKHLKDQDLISCCTMIAGFADHGVSSSALLCFNSVQINGWRPDASLLVCLLKACSHGGLIYEALQMFNTFMIDRFAPFSIDHFICFIDIFGRVDCVREAWTLALKMPFQPSYFVWVSLQNTSVIHSKLDITSKLLIYLDELRCKEVHAGYAPSMYNSSYSSDRIPPILQ
ncbi:hypothetical protein KP509_27G000800 [Ceratopteris richardii]|uniref:Pentatricopeptide repeat-containing protein n=1 Tax=Ceratopteris richardii TaxID=49495 RepID=A0A8T2REW3_CERRI|nr:hypothetical protein KP509_27G000800 [Ceratopteris richardii]